jgi:hypothetical protein
MRTKIRVALIKFPLELKDGAKVMTIDELRANFDLNKIIDYFKDGTLEKFLRDRFYEDEADALKNLNTADKDFVEKLCNIFCIDELPEIAAWRKERREKLKQFTDDEEIFENIDDVAFNQDELEDILREENIPATIYLCDKIFRFNSGILKKTNIRYVGIAERVTVLLESGKEIDFKAFGITFENVEFDNIRAYTPAVKPVTITTEDFKKGEKLFIEGNNYYYGRNGYVKNTNRAITLYKKSAVLGYKPAKDKLAYLGYYK